MEEGSISRENRIPVYLDQNVFSRLQPGQSARTDMRAVLDIVADLGGVIVYSSTHVEECRASNQPDAFASILEDISAYFMEPKDAANPQMTLSLNRAKELVMAEVCHLDSAMRRMEDFLKVIQFVRSWSGKVEAHELVDKIVADMDTFWAPLATEFPASVEWWFTEFKVEMAKLARGLPLDSLRAENEVTFSKLRARLPVNYAQLDAIPAEDIASFLISRLDDNEQAGIRSQFPPGFWSKIERREEGALTGFAFLLYIMGLVRNPRVKSKQRSRSDQHLLGQFRDCSHIEQASMCPVFITMDAGAARLARAVYSYAGVVTKVLHLTILPAGDESALEGGPSSRSA